MPRGDDRHGIGDINDQAVLAQHRQTPSRIDHLSSFPQLAATRVDIDARGKRTLVNAMR